MHRDARQLPNQHLSVRLPWHDTGWDGHVCQYPSKNSWCMVLKRIRDERNDSAEDCLRGRPWSELSDEQLPSCLKERGAALNAEPYTILDRHPFAKSSSSTHGHFEWTPFRLPRYSVQAVPFRWTRKEDAQQIAHSLALPFNTEREPTLDFETVWINDFENQQIMLDTFFGAPQPENSLIFLYAKRTPLADDPRRVLIGAGPDHPGGILRRSTEYCGGHARQAPWPHMGTSRLAFDPPGWSRTASCSHTSRFWLSAERDGSLSIHRRFVAFAPSEAFDAFSNVAEHVDHDHAIASLLSLAEKGPT